MSANYPKRTLSDGGHSGHASEVRTTRNIINQYTRNLWAAQGGSWACSCIGSRRETSPNSVRREVRAQHESAIETACLETAVRVGDLIERDPLGDARTDAAGRQQVE